MKVQERNLLKITTYVKKIRGKKEREATADPKPRNHQKQLRVKDPKKLQGGGNVFCREPRSSGSFSHMALIPIPNVIGAPGRGAASDANLQLSGSCRD